MRAIKPASFCDRFKFSNSASLLVSCLFHTFCGIVSLFLLSKVTIYGICRTRTFEVPSPSPAPPSRPSLLPSSSGELRLPGRRPSVILILIIIIMIISKCLPKKMSQRHKVSNLLSFLDCFSLEDNAKSDLNIGQSSKLVLYLRRCWFASSHQCLQSIIMTIVLSSGGRHGARHLQCEM